MQYVFKCGIFDVNDIIFNTFGFLLGAVVYNLILNYRKQIKARFTQGGDGFMYDINQYSISDLFGWTCSPVWEKFAVEKNGVFEKGNIIKEQSIKIKYEEIYVVYKAYRRSNNNSGMNTQITAEYISRDNFIFKLREKWSLYTPFACLNKLERVKIDDKSFNKFILKTNNKESLVKLFNNEEIIKLISLEDIFCIEIRKGKKANEKILYLEINGMISNYKDMEKTFNLTTMIINILKD